jgi:putative component of toxin-antitoxin plasmid stabilization module
MIWIFEPKKKTKGQVKKLFLPHDGKFHHVVEGVFEYRIGKSA